MTPRQFSKWAVVKIPSVTLQYCTAEDVQESSNTSGGSKNMLHHSCIKRPKFRQSVFHIVHFHDDYQVEDSEQFNL
jgi:hypothetical protein